MGNILEGNRAELVGRIAGQAEFSHKTYGEAFYEMPIAIQRKSGYEDVIRLMVSERLLNSGMPEPESFVRVEGQVRTYNQELNGKNKLNVVVFVREIEFDFGQWKRAEHRFESELETGSEISASSDAKLGVGSETEGNFDSEPGADFGLKSDFEQKSRYEHGSAGAELGVEEESDADSGFESDSEVFSEYAFWSESRSAEEIKSENISEESGSKYISEARVESDFEPAFENNIYLEGFICKKPVKRVSPLGREICDIMLAVNRMYNKSDYIPCIAWGRNASYGEQLEVGDKISLAGRIQSREYKKRDAEDNVEIKTAYEVSILNMEEIPKE